MNGNVATAKTGGTVTIKAQWNAYQTSPPGNPDCGIPAGVPPPVKPNLPNPCSCTNNLLQLTATATLFVQVPTSLRKLSQGISTTRFPNPLANGCPPNMPFGMEIFVTYQVMDQQNPPAPIVSTMILRENLLNAKVDGQTAGADKRDQRVTATGVTEPDGTFKDDGVGACGPVAFGTGTLTQELYILGPTGVKYPVRTNLWAFTGQSGRGNMNNGFFGDVNVTVN